MSKTIQDILVDLTPEQITALKQKLRKEKLQRAGRKAKQKEKSLEDLVNKVLKQVIIKLKESGEE